MGQLDDPDDPGGGEAGASIAGGLFQDKKALEAKAAAAKAAEEAAAIKANEEFLKQQRIANDKMIAEDQAESDRAHKEYLANEARKRQEEQDRLLEQTNANRILQAANESGIGTLGQDLSEKHKQDIITGGGLNQGDAGGDFSGESGGASSPIIHITQVSPSSNKVDQSTASKVGSAWSHVIYSGEESGAW